MKHLQNVKYTIAAVAMMAAVGVAGTAKAEDISVPVSVTVQNTLTLAQTPMNFGTLVMIRDIVGAATSYVTMNAAGALAVTNTAPAAIATLGGVPAAATVTVSNGAPGATVNFTIDSVTQPQFNVGDALDVMGLSNFAYQWTGGGAPVSATFTAVDGSDIDSVTLTPAGGAVVSIGARLTATASAGGVQYSDNVYTGAFNVSISY